jgi:hypothetical protein
MLAALDVTDLLQTSADPLFQRDEGVVSSGKEACCHEQVAQMVCRTAIGEGVERVVAEREGA